MPSTSDSAATAPVVAAAQGGEHGVVGGDAVQVCQHIRLPLRPLQDLRRRAANHVRQALTFVCSMVWPGRATVAGNPRSCSPKNAAACM